MFGHVPHLAWYLWFLQDVGAVAFLVTGLVLLRRGASAVAGLGAVLTGLVVVSLLADRRRPSYGG